MRSRNPENEGCEKKGRDYQDKVDRGRGGTKELCYFLVRPFDGRWAGRKREEIVRKRREGRGGDKAIYLATPFLFL